MLEHGQWFWLRRELRDQWSDDFGGGRCQGGWRPGGRWKQQHWILRRQRHLRGDAELGDQHHHNELQADWWWNRDLRRRQHHRAGLLASERPATRDGGRKAP